MEKATYDPIFFEVSGKNLPELWDQFLAQWHD
jgi:hypothetical protein